MLAPSPLLAPRARVCVCVCWDFSSECPTSSLKLFTYLRYKSLSLTITKPLTPRIVTLLFHHLQTNVVFRRRTNVRHFFADNSVASLFVLKMNIKSYLEYRPDRKSWVNESTERMQCSSSGDTPSPPPSSLAHYWLVISEFTSGVRGKEFILLVYPYLPFLNDYGNISRL